MCQAHATLYKFCGCTGATTVHPCTSPSQSCRDKLSSELTPPLPIVELHCYCYRHSTSSFVSARDHRKKTKRTESRERKTRARDEDRQRKKECSRKELEECAVQMREGGSFGDGHDHGRRSKILGRLRAVTGGSRRLSNATEADAIDFNNKEMTDPRRWRLKRAFSEKDKDRSAKGKAWSFSDMKKDKQRYSRLSLNLTNKDRGDEGCAVM